MINCPYCGKLTDPKLDNCPHCGGFLQKRPAGATGRRGAERQTCPNCHALVQDGDIICVACGTNLLTGQKIADEGELAPSASTPLIKIVVGVVVGLIVTVGLAVLAYVLTRDPVRQALDLKAQGRVTEATQLLQDYTATHSQDAHAYLELGKLQFATQPKLAADTFQKALSLAPGTRDAALLAALSLAAAGDPATRTREADLLGGIVERDPGDADVWYLLALARGSSGDLAGQIDALKKAAELKPGAGEYQTYLGIALALQGDPAGAEREVSAQAGPSETGNTAAALGIIKALQGKPDEAAQHLSDALQKRTTSQSEVLTALGLLLVQQGQYGAAEPYLNQAKRLGRNDAAEFFHAVALQGQQLFDSALSELDAVAKGNGLYAAKASVNMAQIYLAQGNVDKARQAADDAGKKNEAGAPLLTVRGRIQALANDDAGAQDTFKRAIQADPDYAPAHLENGLLYIKRQVIAEGVRELEQYLALAGPETDSERTGDIRELVEQLKETAQDSGSHPDGTESRGSDEGAVS